MVDNNLEEGVSMQYEQEVQMNGTNDTRTEENKEKQDMPKSPASSGPREPCQDMTFDDIEDAKALYKAYARRVGFEIRINHTRLSKTDKVLIGVDFVCSREGTPKQSNHGSLHKSKRKNRLKIKIGCKANMGVSLNRETGKWVVIRFNSEHNHELYPPGTTSLVRGRRKIKPSQMNLISVLNGSGGEVNSDCSLKDVGNHLGDARPELIKEGDAKKMNNYFRECHSKNPGFFYSIQLDENNRVQNCFWADARSRLAYKYFGDVVTIDDTYLTDLYSLPLVLFTGVNHHHQSVMFGCALLVDRTTSSYMWLLRTWLASMFGRAPSVVITDESMCTAIARVLPNTTHRLCMWNILQKVPEYLGHVFNIFPSLQCEFHHCIHDTVTIEEFEYKWNEMIQKYGLLENDLIKKIYEQREKWIPAYLPTIFCAGMSTMQRSESMNKFFRGFARSSTLVSDFVLQYEKALEARYVEEKENDLKTKKAKPLLKTCYKIEADAADIYTRNMFLKFQEELFSSQKYTSSKHNEEGTKKRYFVMLVGKEKPVYEVVLDISNKNVVCSCHMFEFVGILCRHIFAIFVKKSFTNYLPQEYVLQRWTINAKSHAILERSGEMIHEDPEVALSWRRHSLMVSFLEIVEEGQKSQKKHDHLARALQKVHSELVNMDVESESQYDFTSNEQSGHGPRLLCSDPLPPRYPVHVSSRRPKPLRQKHLLENQVDKKRKCSNCKQTGHNMASCSLQQLELINGIPSPLPSMFMDPRPSGSMDTIATNRVYVKLFPARFAP